MSSAPVERVFSMTVAQLFQEHKAFQQTWSFLLRHNTGIRKQSFHKLSRSFPHGINARNAIKSSTSTTKFTIKAIAVLAATPTVVFIPRKQLQ